VLFRCEKARIHEVTNGTQFIRGCSQILNIVEYGWFTTTQKEGAISVSDQCAWNGGESRNVS
jgi:hypothetical protein